MEICNSFIPNPHGTFNCVKTMQINKELILWDRKNDFSCMYMHRIRLPRWWFVYSESGAIPQLKATFLLSQYLEVVSGNQLMYLVESHYINATKALHGPKHQKLECLFNRSFKCSSKKTSKDHIAGHFREESSGDLFIPLFKCIYFVDF